MANANGINQNGGSGNDVLVGGHGNDKLSGGSGNDMLLGAAGADDLKGDSGRDILDGGSGSDRVEGGADNDLLIYVASQNAGQHDNYDGGSHVDTLRLVLTQDEWLRPGVQADVQRYLQFVAAHLNPSGQTTGQSFEFHAFGLAARRFEHLEVIVEGILIDPLDQAVTLANDAVSATEEGASSPINVLENDSVPDLVQSVTFTQAAHGTVQLTHLDVSNALAPIAAFVYMTNPAYFQYLAVGESASDAFTYSVNDSDGDTSTAIVAVSIVGTNDVVAITGGPQNGAVAEDADATPSPGDSTSATGTIAFTDVDASDTHTAVFAPAAGNTTSLGTFALTSVSESPNAVNGSVGWSYTLNDAAAQHLAQGASVTEVYTVIIGDAYGSTAAQNVTITIAGANDVPVAANDALGMPEDTSIVVSAAALLANDVDIDAGDSRSIVSVHGAVHGMVSLATGIVAFSPDADYDGPASFGYTIQDAAGEQSTATVHIAVSAVNDAPLFTEVQGSLTVDLGGDDAGRSMLVQPDGKIVVGGFTYGTGQFALIRYNADGILDASFDGDGKVITAFGGGPDEGYAIAIQSDGKLLQTGVTFNGSTYDVALARYNTNGSLDLSFGAGTGKITTDLGTLVDLGNAIAVQADGKIVVGGLRSNSAGSGDFAVLRYNADGTLDPIFDGDGKVITDFGADEGGASILVQPDGKIVVSGAATAGFPVARYNVDGSLDPTFSGDGRTTTSFGGIGGSGHGVKLQPDGKLLVGGYAHNDFALERLNADGSLDTSFNGTGSVSTSFGSGEDLGFSVALQPDGKIMLAGYTQNGSQYDFALIRYNADGSLDGSFDGDGKLTLPVGSGNDRAYAIAVSADGKILVAGESYNGPTRDVALVRLNSDGSLDPTFATGSTLNGGATYIEAGAAVAIDNNVGVFDIELAAQGHYAGALLTLTRSGGANAEDVFAASGALSSLTEGGALIYSGMPVGVVTTNSAGTLVLTFDGGAGQAAVDGVLQSIGYTNTSDTPPASVQIDWTFSDGNAGAQGSGGALAATGSTIVNIQAVDDAPVAHDDDYATNEDTPLVVTVAGVLANDTDVDSTMLTAVLVSGPSHGSVALAADGSFVYTPTPDYNGSDSFIYSASDGSLASNVAIVSIGIAPVADITHRIGMLDASGTIPGSSPPRTFVGSGNLATSYNITFNEDANLELGLKVHYRGGVDILQDSVDPDGTAHYRVPAGTQVVDAAHQVPANAPGSAAWNFDFSVNTGLNGSSKTLADYDFRILVTDDEANTATFDLQHVVAGVTPWQVTPGLSGAGLGDDDGVHATLSQNSVNVNFSFLQSIFGVDRFDAGERYDVELQAFDGASLVGAVHDVITVVPAAPLDVNSAKNLVAAHAPAGTTTGLTAGLAFANVTYPVTYQLSTNPGGRFAIDSDTGMVRVADSANLHSATYTVGVQGVDRHGLAGTEKLFTVIADAGGPTAIDFRMNTSTLTALEGTGVGLVKNVQMGSFIASGDPDDVSGFSYSSSGLPAAFTLSSAGVLSTTAGTGTVGAGMYSFNITATDHAGAGYPFTIPVNVWVGTAAADTQTFGNDLTIGYGLAGNDVISGGTAGDSISGGAGDDALSGGAGDDRFIYDAVDTNINGGFNTDTLILRGSGVTLNLALVPAGADVEIIDIAGTGANTALLKLSDVLAISPAKFLRIDGNAGDHLTVSDAASWTSVPSADLSYHTYTQLSTLLLVDTDVESNLV